MTKTKDKDIKDEKEQLKEDIQEEDTNVTEATEESKEEDVENDPQEEENERLKTELQEAKDKYLRLYSEFENFRRRSAKERLELVQSANSDLIEDLLPVIDDFERALSLNKDADAKSLQEGMELIYNKLKRVLTQKGVKPMENKEGMEFDPDIHEAITKIPAPKDELKGKVVDVIEKGYYLNDKVIRFAKVVIGS